METTPTPSLLPASLTAYAISAEEWAATPPSVRRALTSLEDECARLREQAGQTSRNSSKPPSSDPPTVPPRETTPTGRARGGQPGHPGTTRPLAPPAQVATVVPVRPAVCAHCGTAFPPDAVDPHPHRHQVVEVPPVVVTLTEYQRHALRCPHCGRRTRAPWPAGVPRGCLGPRASALIATATAQYHLAKRAVAALLRDWFSLTLSPATVCTAEQRVSAACAAPVAAAVATLPTARRVWMDETGWRQARDPDPVTPDPPPARLPKAWLWTAVTPEVTVFQIRRSRGSPVVTALLGATPDGIIHTDRWNGYHGLDPPHRQLCWAHLQRAWTQLSERPGLAGEIGAALLAHTQALFHTWHQGQAGTLAWPAVQAALAPVQTAVGDLLRDGAARADRRTATTCHRLLQVEPALWTFVRVPGVEPTNNRAERAIRPGVLYRHTSFGTQGDAGSRAVERLLTVVATCRQQQRNVLAYLIAAVEAALHDQPAPSLLPTPTP